MLLRVDTFVAPSGDQPAPPPSSLKPLSPPLFVSPSTLEPNTTEEEHGTEWIALTVGRKNCHVTIESDKSVSRSHCTLAVRQRKNFDSSSKDDKVLVVRDNGSRFGTFVPIWKGEKPPSSKKAKDDDDETGDESEHGLDSSNSTQSTMKDPMIRAAKAAFQCESDDDFNKQFNRKVRKVATSPIALNSLSIVQQSKPLDYSRNPRKVQLDPKIQRPPSALVFCGQVGTMIHVTRVQMEFCPSRLAESDRIRLASMAHDLGLSVVPTWSPSSCTHLVAPDRTATAKAISAWALRRPIVTMGFVEALHRRKQPTDHFPNEDDYRPPGELLMDRLKDDGETPRNCLRNYQLLTLVDDESARMCVSAGAQVLDLSTLDDNVFYSASWMNHNDTQSASLARAVLDCASRYRKRRDFLLIQKKIPCVSPKEVASAISSLRTVLHNPDGNEIPLLVQPNNKLVTTAAATAATAVATPLPPPVSAVAMSTVISPPATTPVTLPPPAATKVASTVKDTHIQKRNEDSTKEPARWTVKRKRTDANEEDAFANQKQTPLSPPSKTMRGDEKPGSKNIVVSPTLSSSSFPNRKRLQTTSNGWFLAAPSSANKRRLYAASKDELIQTLRLENEQDKEKVLHAAPTDLRSDLIVANPKAQGQSSRTPGASRRQRSGPNFKRFRKNAILSGLHCHSTNPILMRSVLPKESERLKQLELSQQESNKRQRQADALFAETSSVHSFFASIASVRRGRGRGRVMA